MEAPPLTRHVTTHAASDKGGTSVSVSSVPVPLAPALGGGAAFAPLFSALGPGLPLQSAHHLTAADIDASAARAGGAVVLPGGINALVTQLSPGFKVRMHRTNSLDFNILTHGSAWLVTPVDDAGAGAGAGEGAGAGDAYPSPASDKAALDDDGEWTGEVEGMRAQRRLVRAGEIVIQTGTLHAWHAGPEGARWITVNAAAEPVSAGGAPLPEVDFS